MTFAFETDREALFYLHARGWDIERPDLLLLSPRPPGEMTEGEKAAIDYLCDEWDYQWDEAQKL